MNMASRKVAYRKSVQHSASAATTPIDEWAGALALLQIQTDPHEAALVFRKCCDILQALVEKDFFTTDEHLEERSKLMNEWAECVIRLEQPGAVTVIDQQRSE